MVRGALRADQSRCCGDRCCGRSLRQAGGVVGEGEVDRRAIERNSGEGGTRWRSGRPLHVQTAGAVGRSVKTKAVVMGILQRGDDTTASKVNATVIPVASGKELKTRINQTVEAGSEVFTDQWAGYKGLSRTHIHQYVTIQSNTFATAFTQTASKTSSLC